jgi:hypothetical protein
MEACIPESGPACSEAELGACTAQCPSDLYEELCLGDAPSPAFVTLCGAFDPSPIDDPEADPEEPPCTDPDGCDDDACDPTVDPDCFPAPPSPVP